MLIFQFPEILNSDRRFRIIQPAAFFRDRRQQTAKQNVIFFADFDLDVLKLFVVSHGEVGRQRPRRGRPNHDERFFATDDGKFHIHALADVIVIFNLGFGERGATGNAPVNRLFAAIDKTFGDDVCEQAEFIRFVFLVQREIRIIPIAQHAEAFELAALEIHVFQRVGFAGLANRGGVRIRSASLAQVLRNLELNR